MSVDGGGSFARKGNYCYSERPKCFVLVQWLLKAALNLLTNILEITREDGTFI